MHCIPHPTNPLVPDWEAPVPCSSAQIPLDSEPRAGKPLHLNTHIRARNKDRPWGEVITEQRASLP